MTQIIGIANGLVYLHNHECGPIIHGDLKGANVLISDDGRALLTDFGASHLVNSTLSMSVSLPSEFTPNWMAPELPVQCFPSAQGDVWSFGMTVLELFTRDKPYHEVKHVFVLMARIMAGILPIRPSEESTCFRMTDKWWNICVTCWAQNPSLRPSMAQILARLEATNVWRRLLF
ncbi:hypothetical protein ID866_11537 [Astraeus odoratus]|nr:hypothetical protein ID866_11537 [Astraeus odoratus]